MYYFFFWQLLLLFVVGVVASGRICFKDTGLERLFFVCLFGLFRFCVAVVQFEEFFLCMCVVVVVVEPK